MIKPVVAAPAYGMLNVCVEVPDDMLKSDPDVPTANVCVDAVRPFKETSPDAPALLTVVHPNAADPFVNKT